MDQLTPDQKERYKVWDALSHHYLDTELQPSELNWITQILAESPFSLDELRHIEVYEVHPACEVNLWCVAGVWSGFAADWLVPRCARQQKRYPYRASRKLSWIGRLRYMMTRTNIDFARIKAIRGEHKHCGE